VRTILRRLRCEKKRNSKVTQEKPVSRFSFLVNRNWSRSLVLWQLGILEFAAEQADDVVGGDYAIELSGFVNDRQGEQVVFIE
jgi:hypothetical protein